MDYKKLDEIVEKLESKFIPESAKGNLEAKEILAITQAYRVLRVKLDRENKEYPKSFCECPKNDHYHETETFCPHCGCSYAEQKE